MARTLTGPARPPMRWLLGIAFLTLLVGGGGGVVPSAQAAGITVTTFQDENGSGAACSLREAIIAANDDAAFGGCPGGSGADTVVLTAGTYHLVFSPYTGPDEEVGDLDVHTPITVTGAGTDVTVVDGAWPDEFETDRIFHVHAGGNLTLHGLTVRDGEPPFDFFSTNGRGFDTRRQAHRYAQRQTAQYVAEHGGIESVGAFRSQVQEAQPECENGSSNPEDGGGIRVDPDATLTANDVVVDHNLTFEGVGGGLFVSCDGHAMLQDVVFSRNFAATGGGVHNDGFLTYTGGSIGTLLMRNDQWPDRNTAFAVGGGLWNSGEATLSRVDLFGNLGLFAAGGAGNDGTLTLERSTVFRNFAGSIFEQFFQLIDFGEFDADGGGLMNQSGQNNSLTLHLTNVTISENAVEGHGGGLFNEGAATANLNNVTVAFNRADDDNDGNGDGGGIYEQTNGLIINTVNLRNTIVAGNVDNSLPGDTIHPDCSGPMASQGTNLVQRPDGCTGFVASDILGHNPGLAPLGDNGGSTLTHMLRDWSPAIDAASGGPVVDQRGVPRPFGRAPDIGAYERFLCFKQPINSVGTPGKDRIDERGDPPKDVILSLGGNDTILAGPGKDYVCSGPGKDRILLGGGRDKGAGQGGKDIIRGGGNPDLLRGGPGNDQLFGGGTLRDKGDLCRGGPGNDSERGCEGHRNV